MSSRPLSFKLRAEEEACLRKVAEQAGLGPSSFAAAAVRQAIGTTRHRAAPVRPSEIAQAIRDATGALGRLGNNLNQIARRTNIGGRAEAEALAGIRAELAAIDAKLGKALAS